MPNHKPRILVIDDEQAVIEAVRLKLIGFEFELISAGDGSEGLHKAHAEKPDLIILDIMLPKIDGYRLCRMLKFDEKYKKIPVIVLTAKSEDSDMEQAKKMGADAFLTKPFNGEDLKQTIQSLLR
jgi:CheY-like chemotaxis protein